MSELIHQLDSAAGRSLKDKLKDFLGVHPLELALQDGGVLQGIVSEIGTDYIQVIETNGEERLIALTALLWVKPIQTNKPPLKLGF